MLNISYDQAASEMEPWAGTTKSPYDWMSENFGLMVRTYRELHESRIEYNGPYSHDGFDNGSYVYFLFDDDVIVYVGQSVDIDYRLERHWMNKQFTHVALLGWVLGMFLDDVEYFYIRQFDPPFNGKRLAVQKYAEKYLVEPNPNPLRK